MKLHVLKVKKGKPIQNGLPYLLPNLKPINGLNELSNLMVIVGSYLRDSASLILCSALSRAALRRI